MKNSSLIALGSLALIVPTQADFTNQIIQRQTNEFGEQVTYAVPNVAQEGTMPAPLPILFSESVFELWSVNGETGESKKLDTTVVNGFYNPRFEILTDDPLDTTSNPRTRVGVPYSVRITGVSATYQQAAAVQLSMLLSSETYPEGTFGFGSSHTPNFSAGTDISAAIGEMLKEPVTPLPGLVPGEETYSLWEPTNSGSSNLLNSQTVTIWPAFNFEFKSGEIEAGKKYTHFDPINIQFNNLYPNEYYGFRVTRTDAGAIAGNRVRTLFSNRAPKGMTEPKSKSGRKSKLSDALRDLGGGGDYVLEVITQVPGVDPEILTHASIPFTYDARISVNAVIGSSEE